jgi:hypothetical protein
VLAAQLRDRHTTFALAQNCKNLGVAISRHLHQILLRYLAEKILLPHPLSFLGGITNPSNTVAVATLIEEIKLDLKDQTGSWRKVSERLN